MKTAENLAETGIFFPGKLDRKRRFRYNDSLWKVAGTVPFSPLFRERKEAEACKFSGRRFTQMQKMEMLYEGKAKKVYATDDPEICIVSYKDDATAFNGLKKGTITGKGVVNNRMSNFMFRLLEKQGIPTHYVEELSDRETAVKKVVIVPLEVIVRNTAAGSLSKRLGLPEGTPMKTPVLEYSYKNDELGDPMVNDYHIFAMELATREELAQIASMSFRINEIMVEFFKSVGVELIDFTL